MTDRPSAARWRDIVSLGALALSLTALAWALGFAAALRARQPSPPAPADMPAPPNWALFGEAWTFVEREFYWPDPAGSAVTRGAIAGLLDSLEDPYATVVEASSADFEQAAAPALTSSLGAWIERVAAGARVLATVPDSPARLAELAPGDTIVAAGGEVLAGLDLASLLAEIDDADDTEAELVVLDPAGRGRALAVARKAVAAPRVELRSLAPGALYVRVPRFTREVVEQLDQGLAERFEATVAAVVLDLRDNPGGDPESMARVAGRLTEGTVWVEVARDGTETPRPAVGDGDPRLAKGARVVVLVNGGTAGTAEMLAGALRDSAAATLIGEATAGRGTIQRFVPLADGPVLRLTVAHWRTPAGFSVDGTGIEPDRAVTDAAEQLEAAVSTAMAADNG